MSYELNYTKGEWNVNSANRFEINSFNGIAIADCSMSLIADNIEKEANDSLIAVAPKMFELLKEISTITTSEYVHSKIHNLLTEITK